LGDCTMNRFVLTKNGVLFFLLSIALTSATAFGGTEAEAGKPMGAGPAIAAARDDIAEEAYEKRNAEITPWVEGGSPPNPGNAALLYYQAFLLRPEPNEAIRYKMYSGAEPDRQIRTYLGHCLPMIEVTEIASRMPGCIWGVWPERGLSQVALRRQLGPLQAILLVDARTLAADGHYRVALERCLTVRRIARHLSEDPELYIYSTGPDQLALSAVRDVLGVMRPDADILTWFRGQLAVVQDPRQSYAETLRARVRRHLDRMRTTPASLRNHKILAVREAEGEQAKENVRNLTDEQFLSRAREGLGRFTDSIFRILDSEMTYEQKCAQMHRLINEIMEDDRTDPVLKGIISPYSLGMEVEIDRSYPFQVVHQAQINGVKAAVEIYLVVAKTGQLPERLPDNLPKDPFTGRDFVYEITDEGFALRCQGEEFLRRKNRFLEFRVQRK
jgi:hypothetical protein